MSDTFGEDRDEKHGDVKNTFCLQLASIRRGLLPVLFRDYTQREPRDDFHDPIIAPVCGGEIDYGKLFAYCFRRFGYPNRGWDDHKELVRYVLTTPHPDMLLSVTPYVGGRTSITFRFLVAGDAYQRIEAYGERFRNEWIAKALDWREKQGLPDWMGEWVGFCNVNLRHDTTPAYTSWRETFRLGCFLPARGSSGETIERRAGTFFEALCADYQTIEPRAPYYYRPRDWREWNDDDPLKPFAGAATIALRDLSRPVFVRDLQISAFGETENGSNGVGPAIAAGYPSGALGNHAPKEFAELHDMILTLGSGDARKGISRAIDAVLKQLPPL
jgi:hypothetical protein